MDDFAPANELMERVRKDASGILPGFAHRYLALLPAAENSSLHHVGAEQRSSPPVLHWHINILGNRFCRGDPHHTRKGMWSPFCPRSPVPGDGGWIVPISNR